MQNKTNYPIKHRYISRSALFLVFIITILLIVDSSSAYSASATNDSITTSDHNSQVTDGQSNTNPTPPPPPDLKIVQRFNTSIQNTQSGVNSVESPIPYVEAFEPNEEENYPIPILIDPEVFALYSISEKQFRYAPGIDLFNTQQWFEENTSVAILNCSLDSVETGTNIVNVLEYIAEETGVDSRVLISIMHLSINLTESMDVDCTEVDEVLSNLQQVASDMMQNTLIFRFGGDETANISPIILEYQSSFINDVSFSVADAVAKIAINTNNSPTTLLEKFYLFYHTHFENIDSETEANVFTDGIQAVDAVEYRMPFVVSRRYTSGPHGGGNTTSCIPTYVSDASGIDFSGDGDADNPLDNAVLSIADGVVEAIEWQVNYGAGNLIAIKHDNGIVSSYWHLSSINSSLIIGQRISSGAYLGELGDTGCNTGSKPCPPHIHVELRQGGTNYRDWSSIGDPVSWSGQVIDGWGIFAETYSNGTYAGRAVNYYGSAVRMSAVNSIHQVSIAIEGCTQGSNAWAAVEPNFPYLTEENTDNTYFAFTDGNRSIFDSTNFAHCPAEQTTSLLSSSTTAGMCGGIAPPDTTPPSASGFTASVSDGRFATITTSGVQDNSGGSGVKEVRFSAKWGGNWYGIGTDSSSPYSLTWDMCASNVPNGDVELGMEVWDNANNVWIWSQHYGNPHIAKNSACGGSGTPPTGASWNTHAWMNKYLAGYTNWEGVYTWDNGNWPYIYFDWGTGAPFGGWSGDEFSFRLWRNVYFSGGYYDFRTDADDGVKVYVDGQVVVDRWWDGSGAGGGGKTISAGWHEVKVEFYENKGDAKLSVVWYGPGYPQPDLNAPDGRITAPSDLSATKQSPLTISADAWDDVSGVNFVRFMAWYCLNGTCSWHELGSDYSAPYNLSWNWSSLSDQRVWLAIHVADKTGKITYDPGGWVIVDLDRSNPTAQINYPTDNLYHTGSSVAIQATASDNGSGIALVQFFAGYNDGTGNYWHELGVDTDGANGWQKTWSTSGISDQTDVSFFIYAYDRANNYLGHGRWNNTLDRVRPTSNVFSLPATSLTSFPVTWTGTDAVSGLASYDIQYQDNGGSWQYWKTGTVETSSTFTGSLGHTYAFRSRAIDKAGNIELWPSSPDATTQVLLQPTVTLWSNSYGYNSGWRVDQHARLVSDVNGDGKSDIVGFGSTGVYVSLSNGSGFGIAQKWSNSFGYNSGWRVDNHPRLVGDFNGDGKADIVGFGDNGPYVSLSTGSGFGAPQRWTSSYGYNSGWRVNQHPRLVSDVNGDGKSDIVGFGSTGVYVSLSTGSGFGVPQKWTGSYGYNSGWRVDEHPRLVGDVNGDGKSDIVGFGGTGAYVSLSTGSGFGTPQKWSGSYGYNSGWRVDQHPRIVGDVNGDGKSDIVGFGDTGAYVSLSTGSGFGTPQKWSGSYGYNSGWRVDQHPRLIADVNDDNKYDIVGFGNIGVFVLLSDR